jgi:hypothetical protein
MSWEQSILTIKRDGITMKIPIVFTKTAKVVTQEAEDEYESEEYEDEYLEEYPIYLSDSVNSEGSELDDELGFNPWSDHYSPIQSEEDTDINDELEELEEQPEDNPAIYLAEIAGYTVKTDSNHLEQLGPLDHHQQQIFMNLLEEYYDICARSQTEIERTTEIKHCIYTGTTMPIAQKPY